MGLIRQRAPSCDGGRCPFAPDFGQVPPYFAGHARERRATSKCLDAMQAGGRSGHCLILWGPPGYGKTAMLAWAAAEARARGIRVQQYVAPEIATKEQLIARVARRPRWTERVGEISRGRFRWNTSTRADDALDEILMCRLRKAPLALLIDEAHTLEPSVGRLILNTIQELASGDAAILLVLAGTPILADRLAETEATFWERSEIMPFDVLSEQDASDAVRIPFESAGRAIDAAALAGVVSASNGYPYFLQIWGRLLWGDVDTPTTRVTMGDVNSVRSTFHQERDQFYSLRVGELDRIGLVEAAVAVAEAYGGRQDLSTSEIAASLRPIAGSEGSRGESGLTTSIIRQLEAVGFIWEPGWGRPGCYSRGIPSLMDYVLRAARSGDRSSTS